MVSGEDYIAMLQLYRELHFVHIIAIIVRPGQVKLPTSLLTISTTTGR